MGGQQHGSVPHGQSSGDDSGPRRTPSLRAESSGICGGQATHVVSTQHSSPQREKSMSVYSDSWGQGGDT